MGNRIIGLVILWLVASGEGFRINLPGTRHDAKGEQGGKRGRLEVKSTAAPDVCKVEDSPATCRELGGKYRGGGKKSMDRLAVGRGPFYRRCHRSTVTTGSRQCRSEAARTN